MEVPFKVFEWPPNPAGKFTADSKRRLETAVGNLSMEKFQKESSRRMPGHIREFNRLEPHSSHDLVFKIWRNNKTEATFGVFCLWLWVTRNQISMGTTGIFISRNIKFKILPSINASLSDFTGFFALKTNQKIAIFVWIFTCVDFRGKITTKVCRNRERYHLISWHLLSAFKTTTVF